MKCKFGGEKEADCDLSDLTSLEVGIAHPTLSFANGFA